MYIKFDTIIILDFCRPMGLIGVPFFKQSYCSSSIKGNKKASAKQTLVLLLINNASLSTLKDWDDILDFAPLADSMMKRSGVR